MSCNSRLVSCFSQTLSLSYSWHADSLPNVYYNVCVQVIPEVSSTNIMDMAERMKEKDAKLHDANVSMARNYKQFELRNK